MRALLACVSPVVVFDAAAFASYAKGQLEWQLIHTDGEPQ
jgi:hypothetical protein